MKSIPQIFLSLAIIVAATLSPPGQAAAQSEQVVLAGGCFWGMQAVFESLRGVTKVVAGYAGGSAQSATYDQVSSESTGHAESVSVTFDPTQISFKQLLDVYFRAAHDPTEMNRQGPDQGTSYRSEIFYTTDAQRVEAQATIAALERAHAFSAPIVTTLERLPAFYPAEGYHQDYLVHNLDSPYIMFNDIPKLKSLRDKFPKLVNAQSAPMRVI